MELSNEFSYIVSEDSPSLKLFLEGNEENLEVFCYLASLLDSLPSYFSLSSQRNDLGLGSPIDSLMRI